MRNKGQNAKIRLSGLTRKENEKESLRPISYLSNRVDRDDLRKLITRESVENKINENGIEGKFDKTEIMGIINLKIDRLFTLINNYDHFRDKQVAANMISQKYAEIKTLLNQYKVEESELECFHVLIQTVSNLQKKIYDQVLEECCSIDELSERFKNSMDYVGKLNSWLEKGQKGKKTGFFSGPEHNNLNETDWKELYELIKESEKLSALFKELKDKISDKLKLYSFDFTIKYKTKENIERHENNLKKKINTIRNRRKYKSGISIYESLTKIIEAIDQYDYSPDKHADFVKEISKQYKEIKTLLDEDRVKLFEGSSLTQALLGLQKSIFMLIFKECFPPDKQLLRDYKTCRGDLNLLLKNEAAFFAKHMTVSNGSSKEQVLYDFVMGAEVLNEQYRKANVKFSEKLSALSLDLIKDDVDKVSEANKKPTSLRPIIDVVKSNYPDLFCNTAADGSQKESTGLLSDEKENLENNLMKL